MFEARTAALRYFTRGFVPLFVSIGTKSPRYKNWPTLVQTRENIERQFNRPSNVGLRTGDVREDGSCLIAIDIDRQEHQLLVCVQRAIGDDRVAVKVGKKGWTFVLRVSEETNSRKIYWNRDGKRTAAIDILCRHAQTIVPPSVHPDTHQPYRWVAGVPLDETNYEEVPVIKPTALDEIRGFCSREDDPIFALNFMEWRGLGNGGSTHDTCVAAVASMVARRWPDSDIQQRIQRAKREACETAGMAYDWPQAEKTIDEWIASSRSKNFDTASAPKKPSHGSLAQAYLDEISPRILFDEDKNTWFGFCATQWKPNYDAALRHSIEQFLPAEARNRGLVKGIEESLRDRPELRISSNAWDAAAHLLNTPGGTVDLRTGEMRAPDPRRTAIL